MRRTTTSIAAGFALAMLGSTAFAQQQINLTVAAGQPTRAMKPLEMVSTFFIPEVNKRMTAAGLEPASLKGDAVVSVMYPQKRIYSRGQVQTESAINAGWQGDLYVVLGEPMPVTDVPGAWTLRLYQKPFIRWIWFGGLFMMLGGFVAATDRRLRHPRVASRPLALPATVESRA